MFHNGGFRGEKTASLSFSLQQGGRPHFHDPLFTLLSPFHNFQGFRSISIDFQAKMESPPEENQSSLEQINEENCKTPPIKLPPEMFDKIIENVRFSFFLRYYPIFSWICVLF